LIFSRDLYTH